jgi:hypothetical protein
MWVFVVLISILAPEEPAPLYCGGNTLIETKFR